MHLSNRLRGMLRASSASVLAFAVAGSAFGQTVSQDEPSTKRTAEAAEAEEIVVTASSRVARSGFEAPTPTTVLGEQLLENNAISSVGQISRLIPQQSELNSPTAFTQGFSGVAATTFNLRGLGSLRTLVLVDGRRHVPTAVGTGLNVDVIPSALLERVEVVTGGASADWGSDAVAGVVNLVLKDKLDGFDATLQAGVSEHGDNENLLASLAWGTSFADDRARLIIAGEYYRNEGVLSHAARDWAREQWGLIRNPAFTATNGEYRFILAPDFQSSSATLGGLVLTGVARGTDFGPGGVPRPFVTGAHFNPGSFAASPTGSPAPGQSMSGGSGVTPGIYVAIAQPVERYGTYARAAFDVSENLTAFAEGSFTRVIGRSPTAFAHDAGIIFSAPFTISIQNAFLPATIRNQMTAAGETSFKLGRYSPDFGFIEGKSTFETVRGVLGLEGGLGDWKWTTYYQYGESTEDARADNNIVRSRLNNAVDSVLVGGSPVCRINADANPNNDDPGCGPINLFGEGSPSQAALDYIHASALRSTKIRQHAAAADIAGDPFSTWAGPVSVAAGVEYRHDKIEQASDPISQVGGFFIGQTASSLSGKVSVTEGFAQAVVPLLKDAPLAENVELLGAIRESFYSVEGPVTFPTPGIASRDFNVTTWKVGLSWSVNDQLRLRAVRSRDIRAPNVNELFTAGNQANASVFFNGATRQFPRIRGGNIQLEPEKADTWILGAVYQPSWLSGLRLAVDHYDIKIKDAIAAAAGTPQQLIDACAAGNTGICSLFTFDANGIPTRLQNTNVNLNQFRSKGFDIEASYRTPLSNVAASLDGDVELRFVGTRATELSQTTTIAKIDRLGETGNNNSFRMPKWQFVTSLTYDNGPFSTYLGGRFVGAGKYNVDYNRNGALDLEKNRMSARYYVNASVSYDIVNDGNNSVEVYGVVNNLFDTDPPVHPQDFQIPIQGSGLYDTIGRTFTLGVRLKY